LKEIGDADSGFEGVGGVGIAEVMGEKAIANQAGDAAQENAGGDEKCGAGRAKTPRGGVRAGSGIRFERSRSVQGVLRARYT
jgi:hypothetical protein